MRMSSLVAAIVGIIIAALTTAIYFLFNLGDNAGLATAFIYLWVAQGVTFGGIVIMGGIKSMAVTRIAISAILMKYFVITLIVTPFMALLANHQNWLTLIQLLIIAGTLISLVVGVFITGTADKSSYKLPTTNRKDAK